MAVVSVVANFQLLINIYIDKINISNNGKYNSNWKPIKCGLKIFAKFTDKNKRASNRYSIWDNTQKARNQPFSTNFPQKANNYGEIHKPWRTPRNQRSNEKRRAGEGGGGGGGEEEDDKLTRNEWSNR